MGSAAGAVEETVDALVAAGRAGRDAPGPPLPAVPGRRRSWPRCRPRSGRSRSSTGRRSRARSASRSTWRSSRRSPRRWTRDEPPFAAAPRVIGGRYGLSSKEMTPVDDQADLRRARARRGRSGTSRSASTTTSPTSACRSTPSSGDPRPAGEVQAMFFGLGSDGTVGANKASVKIIGESTDLFAQGYFVYDSKKSGSVTVSHLRFGPEPIRSTYLIEDADFVACHQFGLLGKMKVLEYAKHGATFLLNAPVRARRGLGPPARRRPAAAHRQGDRLLGDRRASPSPTRPAWATGSTRSCSRASSSSPASCPPDEAIARIKGFVEKTYAKRGEAVVERNFAAIDRSLERLGHVPLGGVTSDRADDPAGARRRARLRRAGHGAADGRRRRPAAGQRAPGRRHVPDRHDEVREAGDRPEDPDLGSRRSASTAASARSSARTRRSG